MKKEKVFRVMIVTVSIVLIMSVMSVRAVSATSHLSNTIKSAEIDTLEDNLKNDLSYNTSTLVSEDSTEFLIGFSDKSEEDKVINWLTNNLNAEIVAMSNYTSLLHFKTNETKGFEVQSLVNSQKHFGVRYIQDHPEFELFDTWIPNDPYLGNQWYIDKIQAKQAWFYEKGDPYLRVAVLDTGVDIDHPDLVANIETSTDWDYVGNDGNPNALQDWLAHNGNAHGTNCAGLIAAVQNNNKGIAGLADINIVNFRVGWVNWFGTLVTSLTYWVDAIYRAVDVSHVDIISISLGTTTYNTDLYNACDYAEEEGVLVVASAGNHGFDLDSSSNNVYPAEWDSVMCVAATDENDNRAVWGSQSSNYGDQTVDICAPGKNIYTTHWKGGYTSGFGGTSASAPIVAGVAALIMSHHPSYSLTDLWNALVDEADDIGNPQIRSRLNAYYSVISYWVPSSYTITPLVWLTGSYHSGSLSNLNKVDSLYFTWRKDSFWVYHGFSVDFYFPDHYISRLKVNLLFGGFTCLATIHWFGGGSDSQYFSESLNYDCNSQRIDHITIDYQEGSSCPLYVYFDRVILVGL